MINAEQAYLLFLGEGRVLHRTQEWQDLRHVV